MLKRIAVAFPLRLFGASHRNQFVPGTAVLPNEPDP